ncbi:MAG TPA: hypothetical protein VGP93_02080, partial [Polyangiaceae bacterium]|nr:hypothetical protein [Polyangiaceae bacterium]
ECTWTYVTCNSPIAVIPIVNGNAFGTPQIVATNSDPEYYNYYPTWAPDGKWIAFQSAKKVYNGISVNPKSLGNSNGVVRLVPVDGGSHTCPGPSCFELTLGTQYSPDEALAGTGKRSTWPKFSPFAQGTDGNIMFITLTSRVDYGFLAAGGLAKPSQLWMFAIDVSKTGQGDASYAPIWLPYQDYADASLTPVWAETLPCQVDPSGGCSGCVAGEECSVSADNQCECRAVVVK